MVGVLKFITAKVVFVENKFLEDMLNESKAKISFFLIKKNLGKMYNRHLEIPQKEILKNCLHTYTSYFIFQKKTKKF